MSEAPTVGIIGLGIGRAHIAGFQANGCQVVAVSQRDAAAARAVADRYGIPGAYSRWQDLIAEACPQIVVIASPPNLHREMALAAFSSGAHVLCEKPMAMNAAEARDMVAAAKQHGRIAMTCFNWRETVAMQEMGRRLAAGEIGRILHVHARWFGGGWADSSAKSTWRMDAQQAGHGATGDMGVHLIDMLRWRFGEIVRVMAAKGVAYPQRSAPGIDRPADADDYCTVIAELAGGAHATLSLSRVAHGANEHTLEAYGEKGSLVYRLSRTEPRWFEGSLQASVGGSPLKPVSLPSLPPGVGEGDPMEQLGGTLMAALIARFLEGIRAGKAPSPTLEDGLRAQLVLDSIAEAAAGGGWIEVKKAVLF